jgi:hypothetical protein
MVVLPPPLDVAITVPRFSRYEEDEGRTELGAEVRITNRSSNTVWYLMNPEYCVAQLVDEKWLESAVSHRKSRTANVEEDWWSPLDGGHSIIIFVGHIRENAMAMKVVAAFTTDKVMPSRHWASSPKINIVKKGKDRFPETEQGEVSTQSLEAPAIFFP